MVVIFNKLGFRIRHFYLNADDLYKSIVLKVLTLFYYKFFKKVLIGFVFSDSGGVANHIKAISDYSKYKPRVLVESVLLKRILVWNKKEVFKSYFDKCIFESDFQIHHSHVDPWYINICDKLHKQGKKWIHTYHTLYFDKDWDNGLEAWQKETNKALTEVALMADVRISVSKWLKQYLMGEYGIDTIYIPNGVDVDKCDKADSDRFYKKYPYRDFVLFASGISDVKNPIDFIRLAIVIPDQTFVMIGRQLSTEALISKYNVSLPANLHIIGQMPHNELLDAIAACKVFVVTSRSEGLPTVLMEAMALERTVVGCNTFGTKEVIDTEEYGYIYDHTSFDDLVNKILKALNDSEKGPRARKRILENYDWKIVIPQIDEVYTQLLNGKN